MKRLRKSGRLHLVLAVKPQSDGCRVFCHISARSLPRPPLKGEGKGKAYRPPRLAREIPGGEGVPLYLSIAAGKTLTYYASQLGEAPVVRAMPNTPALIGKGISALCANAITSEAQKQLAQSLLGAAGEVVWLTDESKMDAVTAISGSGPAYVFLLMEALIEAGKAQGLPEDVARKLALHTVRGSAKLALKSGRTARAVTQKRRQPRRHNGSGAQGALMKKEGLQALLDEALISGEKAGGGCGEAISKLELAVFRHCDASISPRNPDQRHGRLMGLLRSRFLPPNVEMNG